MTAYYMIMASLPRHDRQYKSKQPLISKLQLEKRLATLKEPEKQLLNDFIFVVWESWFKPELPLEETLKRTKSSLESKITFIPELMQWFFNVRCILLALNLRSANKDLPKAILQLPNTALIKISKNWGMPDFGLKSEYPWITQVSAKLSSQETIALEDFFLALLWKHLDTIETHHYFDFEALILYLLRWHIVKYWLEFDEKKAQKRIIKLADTLLEKHLHLVNPKNRKTSPEIT